MINNIKVSTIECGIPASDYTHDNYLFDWKRNISYLVLTARDQKNIKKGNNSCHSK